MTRPVTFIGAGMWLIGAVPVWSGYENCVLMAVGVCGFVIALTGVITRT